MMTALVSGSASNSARQSTNDVPGHGIAADAHAGGDADALLLQLVQRLVGERAGAADDADGRLAGLRRLGDLAGGDADVALARG
jgi:hypothetical protein